MIKLSPTEYAFIFRDSGNVEIATGESAKPEATPGETLARIRQLGFNAMISGDETRARQAEIAAATVGMLTSPALFATVVMAIGAVSDSVANSAGPKILN